MFYIHAYPLVIVYRDIFVVTKSFCKQVMMHQIWTSAHSMRSVSRTREAHYEARKTTVAARMEAMRATFDKVCRDQGNETKQNTWTERKGKVADLDTRMRSFHKRQKVSDKKEVRRGGLCYLPFDCYTRGFPE